MGFDENFDPTSYKVQNADNPHDEDSDVPF